MSKARFLAANNPVFANGDDILELPANAVVGTAEDLFTKIKTALATAGLGKIESVLVSNPSIAGSIWLRTATIGAATAGEGVEYLPGSLINIGAAQGSGLLIENPHSVYAAVFFAD